MQIVSIKIIYWIKDIQALKTLINNIKENRVFQIIICILILSITIAYEFDFIDNFFTKKGKWETTFSTSPFDDSETVVVKLNADKKIKGFLDSYLPKLFFRCKEGSLEIYINVGVQQDVEYDSDKSTVRLRFDDEENFTTKMGHSKNGEALFFQNSKDILLTMVKHKKMIFEFTPFNASPTITSFDLEYLREKIQPLIKVCSN